MKRNGTGRRKGQKDETYKEKKEKLRDLKIMGRKRRRERGLTGSLHLILFFPSVFYVLFSFGFLFWLSILVWFSFSLFSTPSLHILSSPGFLFSSTCFPFSPPGSLFSLLIRFSIPSILISLNFSLPSFQFPIFKHRRERSITLRWAAKGEAPREAIRHAGQVRVMLQPSLAPAGHQMALAQVG